MALQHEVRSAEAAHARQDNGELGRRVSIGAAVQDVVKRINARLTCGVTGES